MDKSTSVTNNLEEKSINDDSFGDGVEHLGQSLPTWECIEPTLHPRYPYRNYSNLGRN